MSLGERFRAAREQRGLTLSEVAEHLRIRSVYLAAIEEENWAAIGAPVYTRGFLRTYARYLNLDAEEAVGEYNSAAGVQPGPVMPGPASRREARGLGPLLWVAGAVAVLLVGFVVYLYLTPPGSRSPAVALGSSSPAAPASPSAAPAAAPPPSPPAAAQPRTLAIYLTAPSWLRVTVDGSVSIEGTFPAGTRKTFHGSSALVRVGNAGGVNITVDGHSIGKLGAAGDVVEKNFVL